MKNFLRHLFFPHESNNHRAKILHHSSLLIFSLFFLAASLVLTNVQDKRGDILGVTSNITAVELLQLTNQKRAEQGLSPLKLDNLLSNAAASKASDMFTKNYWAHNAPDGTTPWVFIKGSGYDYLYAGENLARGFSTSSEVVNAWMNSPGHRENMMSENYEDIGFAILPGVLTGDETVLVVEMFGSKRSASSAEIASAQSQPDVPFKEAATEDEIVPQTEASVRENDNQEENPNTVASVQTNPLIDTKTLTKSTSFVVLSMLIAIFLIDFVVITRKKIFRVVSHNADVTIFLFVILAVIIIIGNGAVI